MDRLLSRLYSWTDIVAVTITFALLCYLAGHYAARYGIEPIGMFLLVMIVYGLLFFLYLYGHRHPSFPEQASHHEATAGDVDAMSTEQLRTRHEVLLSKNKALMEASRTKSEFLAHMSHELRTPLNAIMGFSTLLKNGQLGSLSKQQLEYVSEIYSSSQYLLSLVNDTLDMSKIEAGKMTLDLQAIEIDVLLMNCISIFTKQDPLQRERLLLDIHPGLDSINADPRRAKQIIYNLLSNALKFSASDKQVELRARRVARDCVGKLPGYQPSLTFPPLDNVLGEFLEISVADQGIGIPSAKLERLFQPYSREAAEHKFEGTGLGLMLVKQLTEMHGGTVAVESVEGQGSRFVVWLPLPAELGMDNAPEPTFRRTVPVALHTAYQAGANSLRNPAYRVADCSS